MTGPPAELRVGELVAILALGQDHAFGQPPGAQLRSCVIATRVAARMGVSARDAETVYWVALLRYLGCTGHAYEVAAVFGDDIATRSRTVVKDLTDPREVLREILLHAGDDRGGFIRVRDVLSMLAGGRSYMEMNFRTGCEVGDSLARRLGMSDDVRVALEHTFERWNGRGLPRGVAGAAIPLPMRIVHLSHDVEAIARIQGSDRAIAVARRRSDNTYDPAVVNAFEMVADETLGMLDDLDPWDAALAAEPPPHRLLRGAALDEALLVAADFADLKAPALGPHSRVVAELAARAATSLGMTPDDACALKRAGLLHDLGRTGVPTTILNKLTGLTRAETDRLELHPLFTEQMLRRSPALATLSPIAGCHHERVDGSGYPKGLTRANLGPAARILAAADCYHLLACADASSAAAQLRRLARDGRYDQDVVDAVLSSAGHRERRSRPTYPAGLTAREVEVLRLAAVGRTARQIAADLFITAKTVDHHIQHIYAKIGVSTRGAAALWAMENDLIQR